MGLLDWLGGGGTPGINPQAQQQGGLLGGGDLTFQQRLAAFGAGGPQGLFQAMQAARDPMRQLQMQHLQGQIAEQQQKAQREASQRQGLFGRGITWTNSMDPEKYPLGPDFKGGLLEGASPKEAALARSMDPGKAAEFFGKKMFPDPSYTTVGGNLIDTSTRNPQVVMSGLESEPEKIRMLRAAGLDPTRSDIQNKIVEGMGNARTEFNVNTTQESEQAKKIGQYLGEQFTQTQTRGMQAASTISKLRRVDQLLDQVNTGKFAGTTQSIKAAAKGVGIDLESLGVRDDVAPAQAAQSLLNEMALEVRSTADGGGMPGDMSDADRQFLQSIPPGIENTPEGRKMIISARVRIAERQQEIAKMARGYAQANGGKLDMGFFDAMARYAEEVPLFGEDDMTDAEVNRLPIISSQSEYDKLPSGTRYRAPDGSKRTKQ